MSWWHRDEYRVSPTPAPASGRLRVGVVVMVIIGGVGLIAAHYGLPDFGPPPAKPMEPPAATITRPVPPKTADYTPEAPIQSTAPVVAVPPKVENDGMIDSLRGTIADLQRQLNDSLAQMHQGVQAITPQPIAPVTPTAPKGPTAEDRKRAKQEAEQRRKEWERDKKAWKSTTIDRPKTDLDQKTLQHVSGPNSLSPLTLIHCKVEAEMSNETKGSFRAVVTHDVLDSLTHTRPLIPAGSFVGIKPVGQTLIGDTRLTLTSNVVRLPNGDWLPLSSAQLSDQMGKPGLGGDVDNHYGRLILATITRGALRAGTFVGGVGAYGGGFTDRLGASVAGETVQQGIQQTQQYLRTEPTITVPYDASCNIMLEEEVVVGQVTRR